VCWRCSLLGRKHLPAKTRGLRDLNPILSKAVLVGHS
jgi:hypothetical protein